MKNPNLKLHILALIALISFSGFSQEIEVTETTNQEAEVQIIQDEGINQLLEYKKDIKRTVEVYKIQVFQSSDPDKADAIKSGFLKSFNNWPVEIQWNTPNYKIWVGNFRSRLEADRALVKIKKKYMNAFIFQPKKDKS